MTEKEAWTLNDAVTGAEITLGPNGGDRLSQREARLLGRDDVFAAADKKHARIR
jgi:hypothetical protein